MSYFRIATTTRHNLVVVSFSSSSPRSILRQQQRRLLGRTTTPSSCYSYPSVVVPNGFVTTTTTTRTTTSACRRPFSADANKNRSNHSVSYQQQEQEQHARYHREEEQQEEEEIAGVRKIVGKIETIEALEKAVEELELLPEFEQSDHYYLIQPLIGLCKTMCEKNKVAAAELVERIFLNCYVRLPQSMEERYEQHDKLVFLTVEDYNMILLICGSQRSLDGAVRASRVMDLMINEYRKELRYLKGQKLLLDKHNNNSQTTTQNDDQTRLLAVPNMHTYKFLKRAWALSGTYEGIMESELILSQMEEWSGIRKKGQGENTTPYYYTEDHPIVMGEPLLDYPDVECYNTVLTAYARISHDGRALERAKILVAWMKQQTHVSMDWFSYYALLQCYRKAIRAGNCSASVVVPELEALLSEFHTIPVPEKFVLQFSKEADSPLGWAYGILVDAFLLLPTTEQQNNIQKAHDLVMALAGDSFQITALPLLDEYTWPSHETILAVYKAWTRHSSAQNKQDRLQELIDIACGTDYWRLISFTKNLQLWADSGLKDTPIILEQMLAAYTQQQTDHDDPDTVVDFNNNSNIHEQRQQWQRPRRFHADSVSYQLVLDSFARSEYEDAPQRNERIFKSIPYNVVIDRHVVAVLKSWSRCCSSGQRHRGRHGNLLAVEHMLHYFTLLNNLEPWKRRNDTKWKSGVHQSLLDAWVTQVLPPDIQQQQNGELFRLRNSVALLTGIEHSIQYSTTRHDEDHQRLWSKLPVGHYKAVLRCCCYAPPTGGGGHCSPEFAHEAYLAAKDIFGRSTRTGRDSENRRDSEFYLLMVQIAKQQAAAAAAAAQTMTDSTEVTSFLIYLFCQAKKDQLVTQEFIWEIAPFLDASTLEQLFLISRPVATKLVQLMKESRGEKHLWTEHEAASSLLIDNLPKIWSFRSTWVLT